MSRELVPALPWASRPPPVEPSAPAEGAEDDIICKFVEIADVLGPLPDNASEPLEIEVLWRVHVEEEGSSETTTTKRWWPATVCTKLVSLKGEPAYELTYEAFGEAFAEQKSLVHFYDDHTLLHVDDSESWSWWRKKADSSWEAPEEEEEGGEEDGAVEDVQEGSDAEAQGGGEEKGEGDFEAMLQSLDPYKQRVIADGMSDFFEGLRGFIARKRAGMAPGDTLCVTSADMEEFKQEMTAKRPRTS